MLKSLRGFYRTHTYFFLGFVVLILVLVFLNAISYFFNQLVSTKISEIAKTSAAAEPTIDPKSSNIPDFLRQYVATPPPTTH